MSESELQSQGAPGSVPAARDQATMAALVRLVTRLDLTIAAFCDADAALRRSAAAIFAPPERSVPVSETESIVPSRPAAPLWDAPPWLRPLQKSVSAPSASLARLFFATFERWLTQAPEAETLRTLEARLPLARTSTAILAAVLTLDPPPTPAALASALADEAPEARRHILALMLPGAELIERSLIVVTSPLAPISAHPTLFASAPDGTAWMPVLAESEATGAPFHQPNLSNDDRDEDPALVQTILDAVAASADTIERSADPQEALQLALDAVAPLRAHIAYGSLDPRALASLASSLRTAVRICLRLPDLKTAASCLDAIGAPSEGDRTPHLRDVAVELAGASYQAQLLHDWGRVEALALLGLRFTERLALSDLDLIFRGLLAESQTARGDAAATTTWRAILSAGAGSPSLSPLRARASRLVYPAFGLFAQEASQP